MSLIDPISSKKERVEVTLNSTRTIVKNQDSPCKRWCFTYFMKEKIQESVVIETFNNSKDLKADKWIMGREICPETKKEHLQGYVEFSFKKRLTALKKGLDNTIHWEKAKGDKQTNIKYCTKEGNYISNGFNIPRPLEFPEFNKPWQKSLLMTISQKPDDRSIHWVWSKNGGTGKTTFTKYLWQAHQALLLPPKSADAMNAINNAKLNDLSLNLCVFDIPRTSLDFINYATLEKVKDGMIVSGKYEGCSFCIPSPHVIIFANELPIFEKMSRDRWVVTNIDE